MTKIEKLLSTEHVTDLHKCLKYVPGEYYKIKVCLIGDGGVGKTTYINRVLNGMFTRKYEATAGAVIKNLVVNINGDAQIEYQVWDTAGQEKHKGLGDGYYVKAAGAFIFADATSRETITNLPKYLNSFTLANGKANPCLVVCLNKIDLVKNAATEKAVFRAVKESNNPNVRIVQMSAKSGYNFAEPFEILTKHLFADDVQLSAQISLEPLQNDYDILADPNVDVNNLTEGIAGFRADE
ncbi:GSP1 [Hepatospora eriocheir]|uniref:GSP1 n=2 Tax=Hepatospora eriocheir TaxID=1081669 RepID=A0A1X0QAJ4_9MICR|nr:GSP1 [Hepatospora eriocheir]